MSISGFPGPQFFSASGQTHSELATLSNGNFVVVHQDASSINLPSINLEVLTPTGGGVGIATASLSGSDPDVAALRDGGYVVVWTDPASSNGDIRMSIYSNDGGLTANQVLVNTSTAGAQNEASLVGLADGGFLVTWENDPKMGNVRLGSKSDLVLAQRFDAVGNKIGDEFTVKKGVSVDSPDVGLLSDGRIAFAVGNSTGDPDVMTSIWDPRDILIQNPNVGGLFDGTSLIGGGAVGGNPGADWHLFA